MQLADVEADFGGGGDLSRLGIDEGAGANAVIAEARDHRAEAAAGADDIEAALGGDLGAAFGDEHGDVGPDRAGKGDDLIDGGELEVQLHLHGLPQAADIVILDMATVLAKMEGDSVGPAQLRLDGGPDGIGLEAAPGLPEGGDVVDVDAEFDHCGEFRVELIGRRRIG